MREIRPQDSPATHVEESACRRTLLGGLSGYNGIETIVCLTMGGYFVAQGRSHCMYRIVEWITIFGKHASGRGVLTWDLVPG